MQFTINAKDLKAALDFAKKAVPSKTTLPVLYNFLLELSDDSLKITGTDMEVAIESSVVPEEIAATGSICAQADKFYDVIKNFKDTIITVASDAKNNVIVKSKSGKFKIPGMNPDDYPLTSDASTYVVAIPPSVLRDGISHTIFAASSNEEFQPSMCGVYADFRTAGVVFVATNGNKAGMFKSKSVTAPVGTPGVTIPTKMCSAIMGLPSEDEAFYNFSFDSRNACVDAGAVRVFGRLKEFSFPDYTSIIPKVFVSEFQVKTEDFIGVLKRVLSFAATKYSGVSICNGDGGILVNGVNVDFGLSGEEIIETPFVTGDIAFSVNDKELLSILSSINDADCVVKQTDRYAIVVMPATKDAGYQSLLGTLMIGE